jgi:hypothetical protein
MRIKGKQLADTLRDEDAPFSRVYASQLTGGLVFKAKNASAQAMTVGQAVYISGVSGEVPEVLLADADGAGTMPAAGLIATGGNAGAEVWIISLGELKGVNTSTFSEGDTLYVSTTAGALVASPPAGSSAKLQNIGRVVRADAAGVIFVGGAGRSAATPNLDEGHFFIGNASDQSSASVYTLPIADGNAGDVLTTDGAGAVTFSAPSTGGESFTTLSANITEANFTAQNYRTLATNSTDLTIYLKTTRYYVTQALALDGEIFTIENVGTGIISLRISDPYHYSSGTYYQTYLRHAGDYDTNGMGLTEPTIYQIKPFHRVQIHCAVTVNTSDIKRLTYNVIPIGGPLSPFTTQVISTTTTGLKTNYLYLCDTSGGAFTAVLQNSTLIGDGERIDIKNVGGNTLTVDGYSTQQIDGSSSITLAQYESVTLVSSGSKWFTL